MAGIAEVGIGTIFSGAWEAGDLPIGLNTLMQHQFLRELSEVAPAATINFCRGVITNISRISRESVSLREFLAPLRAILTSLVAGGAHPSPSELVLLAKEPEKSIREGLAMNRYTPPGVLA